MEQTLYICKSVDVYGPIPPRTGRGHISGEWRIESKLATTRIRVLTINNELEVRLEDLESGEIFGACPVPRGHREAAVENAADSSRNFVLRIVDPATNRHAFLGINFAERSNAFDFNVALTDFEKRVQREEELKKIAAGGGASSSSGAGMIPEAAVLYEKHDFSLKEGEHIRVEVKKPAGSTNGGGFLSRLGATTAAGGSATGKLAPLAPPPAAPAPIPAPPQNVAADPFFNAAAFQSGSEAAPAAQATPAAADLATKEVASTEEGWATF